MICENNVLEGKKHDEDVTDTADGEVPTSKEVLMDEVHPERCNHESSDGRTALHRDIGLGLLQTCRQVYDEASPIFWLTTTFAFKSSTSFELWIDQRPGFKVRSIKSLRFDIIKDDSQWCDGDGWGQVLSMGRVKRLVGLRHLRLSIYHSIWSEAYQGMKNWGIDHKWYPRYPEQRSFTWIVNSLGGYRQLHYLKSLKKMATLPLAKVEVSVRDACQTSQLDRMWSMADQQEYARAIKDALLDSQGAAIYARDVQRAAELTSIRWGEAQIAELLDIFPRLSYGAST